MKISRHSLSSENPTAFISGVTKTRAPIVALWASGFPLLCSINPCKDVFHNCDLLCLLVNDSGNSQSRSIIFQAFECGHLQCEAYSSTILTIGTPLA